MWWVVGWLGPIGVVHKLVNRGGGVIGVRLGGLVSTQGWCGDWGQVVVGWLEHRGGEWLGPRGGGNLQIVVLLKKECSFSGGDM